MYNFIENEKEMKEVTEVLNIYRKYDGEDVFPDITEELLECSNPMVLMDIIRRIGKQFTISKHLYNNCLAKYGNEPDFIMYVLELNLFLMAENRNKRTGRGEEGSFTERELYTTSEIIYRFYDVKKGIAENNCGPLFVIKAKPEIYKFI